MKKSTTILLGVLLLFILIPLYNNVCHFFGLPIVIVSGFLLVYIFININDRK